VTARTDTIAAVLRRPRLKRPLLAHELRQHVVQGLGPGTTAADWTATVPQLADAIDTALQRQEQKDTRCRVRPTAGESTARGQVLAALQAAGHDAAAAAELLAAAFREPHTDPPDTEFRETLAGGHALVVEHGDCELVGSCQCGRPLGRLAAHGSVDGLAALWERHTMTEVGHG